MTDLLVDAQLVARPDLAAERARALAATGVDGLFTFEGAVDYVRWKIERHSGVQLELSPRARRHVLVTGWIVAWRLYRRGGFR